MIRLQRVIVSVIAGISAVWLAPAAHADETVTYEVVSGDIAVANIEYFDGSVRQSLQNVALPWRTTVKVANPRSLGTDGAEVRADWRSSIAALPVWRPSKWVTARIYFGNTVRCENTLDIGNAACYGSTPFNNT